MSISNWRGALEWSLMVAMVFGAGALAQASENDEAQPQGEVIQIGKSDEAANPALPSPNQGNKFFVPGGEGQVAEQELPKFWIGLAGGVIAAENPLRAHVDIPEGEGLIVAGVVPDSPAAKAGVKQHDILLRANDAVLKEMNDLVELVKAQGEKKESIAVDILRHGQRETLYITPELRPANAPQPQLGGNAPLGFESPFGGEGFPDELRRQFGGDNPFAFRSFGPGVIVGGGGGANIPDGSVSVNIQKDDGKSPKITVKRGEETWEIVGDDPESLKQLPEDLRPFVEQMLHGGGGGIGGRMMIRPGQGNLPDFGDGRLRERLERMEKMMENLRKQIGEEQPAAGAVENGNRAE